MFFFQRSFQWYRWKTKTPQTTANALKQISEEDIGLPLQVYNDEGGEFVKHFSRKLKYYDVEQKISRTPPAFVERAIRTFKEHVLKRQKTLKIKDWTDTIKYVVDQYNDKEHTTTGVAPNDAAHAKYEYDRRRCTREHRKECNVQ